MCSKDFERRIVLKISSNIAFSMPKISMNRVSNAATSVAVDSKVNSYCVAFGYKPPIAKYITLNSNELSQIKKASFHFVSKPNEVTAYRFNPNGNENDILKNNPHSFKGEDGKFYIPNKWNSDEPYVIDTKKEQMIMIYADDDFAVCDGEVFEGSYVDTKKYKNGILEYQSPKSIEYGKMIEVTKQAPGSFAALPVGTKVQTLEGDRTISKGDVLTFDHKKNPYIQKAERVLSRNQGFSDEAIELLKRIISEK